MKMLKFMMTMLEGFLKLNRLPDDPEGLVCYAKETDGASIFLKVQPIAVEDTMPVGDPQSVIDGIHDVLADDQGLIEVKNGVAPGGEQYIYSVVKSAKEPSGVLYRLTLHITDGHEACEIQGFFDESGITGIRDSIVFEMAIREGKVSPLDKTGWSADPYDKGRTHGPLMNLSEAPQYDEMFPLHPLSELRRFVATMVKSTCAN